MRDVIQTTATMTIEPNKPSPPYTMQLLLEEVNALRNRLAQYEDETHSGKTAPSVESDTDESSLRKQLIQAQNDRAELEKDFMNQLSIMARENHDHVETLEKKLKMMQCERNIIKANGSFEQSEEIYQLEQQVVQLKQVIAANGDEGTQQLVKKLNATEKQVSHIKDEKEALQQQVQDLDSQKATLLEEITHLRIDFDREAKTVLQLKQEMQEMEKEFSLQKETFQHDFMVQEETIQQHQESYGEMNDSIIELEGQKALLLDEITGLRLSLDREQKTKSEMKTKIEELTAATMEAGDYKLVSMEHRATVAEENAGKLQESLNNLQDELRSVTATYKSDVARLEERLSSRDAQLEECKGKLEAKKKELQEAHQKVEFAHDEVKELKKEIESLQKECAEKEHEIASMVSQRISYEKRATKNIMDHVAEVDDLRAHCESLEDEVEYLKERLHTEMGTPSRPSSPRKSPNRQFRFDRSPPPPPPQATPPKWSKTPHEPPRTPVRGMIEKFERITASGASSRESVPTDCRSSPSPQIIQDESDISMSSGEAEAFRQKAAADSEQVRLLQDQLQRQSEIIGELRAEIATLTATRGMQAILVEKEHAHKSRDDEETIQSLEMEVDDLRTKLESETELVKALREELNILALDKIHHQEEKDSTIEGQRAQRIEMNKLANAVTAAQMETANIEREAKARIKELEEEIDTINAEVEEELAAKQGEIESLQMRLDDQLENVKRMEQEREQICTNINTISNSKKQEIDELHEELMKQTALAAEQSREIDSLMVQVERQKDATEELEYLRFKVRDLEKKSSSEVRRPEMDKVLADNHKLNESLRKMGMERRALQEKLSAVMSEKTSSKSVQVLRERNSSLKKEVERLSRRIQQAEKQATRRIEI